MYTECDLEDTRWRVTVPKSGAQCVISNPKPPVLGPKCGKAIILIKSVIELHSKHQVETERECGKYDLKFQLLNVLFT